MNKKIPSLLPSGFYDMLSPQAGFAADLAQGLVYYFNSFGYVQVTPPLMEFEESLFSGRGKTLESNTLRLMDPETKKMLGLRTDMTLQVARIAAVRLEKEPRPLRLCYAGDVLQAKGGNLRGERQLLQAGVELIGSTSYRADVEVILMALNALEASGIKNLSIDLNVPSLVAGFVKNLKLSKDEKTELARALARKDASAPDRVSGKTKDTVTALLELAGPAEPTLKRLKILKVSGADETQLEKLEQIIEAVKAARPDVNMTLDAVENRGLEYHTDFSFSVFASGFPEELARGGRYALDQKEANSSTGFTIYINNIVRNIQVELEEEKVYVPVGAPPEIIPPLQEGGYIIINGLEGEANAEEEAERLGCTHIYRNGDIEELK